MEEVVERLDDLLRLALAQQAVVDEDARQLVADRLVHEQRRDGGVDAAGERAEHALAARPAARMRSTCSSITAAGVHDGRGAGDLVEEVLQHVLAVRRVHDLGMELDAVELPRVDPRTRRPACARTWRRLARPRAARRPCRGATSRRLLDAAARRRAGRPTMRMSVLPNSPDAGAVDPAAELERQQLRAVTDAERRDAELEDRGVELRRAVGVDRRRPAGEDQRDRVAPPDLVDRRAVRDELRVDARLAHAPRDQLRVLAAEIDDEHGALLRRGLRLQRDDLSRAGNSARPS